MVFNGDFPRRSIVKLYGEGGVTLSWGADVELYIWNNLAFYLYSASRSNLLKFLKLFPRVPPPTTIPVINQSSWNVYLACRRVSNAAFCVLGGNLVDAVVGHVTLLCWNLKVTGSL